MNFLRISRNLRKFPARENLLFYSIQKVTHRAMYGAHMWALTVILPLWGLSLTAPVLIMAQKRKLALLFAQKPSKLGPNGPHIGWDFTYVMKTYIFKIHGNEVCAMDIIIVHISLSLTHGSITTLKSTTASCDEHLRCLPYLVILGVARRSSTAFPPNLTGLWQGTETPLIQSTYQHLAYHAQQSQICWSNETALL